MAAAEKPNKNRFKKIIRWFWILLFAPIITLLLIVFLTAVGAFGSLPSTEELENPQTNLATVIYSSDGKVLGKYYAENRVNVKYKELSPFIINALISTEDARFYDHSGIDGRGLTRVFFRTVIGGDQSGGGGSTLSQQLAKMLFPRAQKQNKLQMVIRKIKEWVIAIRLERQYTKEEIIAMYLNKFDFINTAVGIKSATKVYFSTAPDTLRIEEAALLVGMAKNPALFNPVRRPDTTLHRRNVVLGQMMKYEYISKQQFDSLKLLPLNLKFRPDDHTEGLATYFREYLRDNFLKNWCKTNKKPDGSEYSVYKDGLRIYTSIDSRMQKYAEEAVKHHMDSLQGLFNKQDKKNFPFSWKVTKDEIQKMMTQGMHNSERYINMKAAGASDAEIKKAFNEKATMRVFTWKGDKDTVLTPWDSIRYYKSFLQTGFMSMEPHTGYVKAWVGGINYKHFKYDHVKVGKRQVGSTFKPFVYALAIQEGWSPCKQLPNVKTCIDLPDGKEWCPENSDGPHDKNAGKMITLKKALANSINYITVYIMKQFGPKAVEQFVRRCGITSPIDVVPSMCLGTADISVYEMVGANNVFVNKGTYIEPIFVTRIEDKNGKVLAEFFPRTEEAMSEEKAYVMTSLMRGVVEGGTGSALRYRYHFTNPIAGKTGTTQNNSDGWFMGLTPDLVSGCWVGGEDRSVHFDDMRVGQGATMALPIWALYMKKVYADKSLKISKEDFEKPAHKIDLELDCTKYDKEELEGEYNDPEAQ